MLANKVLPTAKRDSLSWWLDIYKLPDLLFHSVDPFLQYKQGHFDLKNTEERWSSCPCSTGFDLIAKTKIIVITLFIS